jgi:hypothetical protein
MSATHAATSVVATSSNPGLLPDANIRVEWSGAAYTVTITLPPEQEGSSTVRLFVTDGAVTARLFPDFDAGGTQLPNLTNTAPFVSDLTHQTVPVGTSVLEIPLNVSDAETPASALSVQVSADNPLLLPEGSISVEGTELDRTLALRPASVGSGTTTVTVIVSDGLLITTKSFVLTIGSEAPAPPPANTAPFIGEVGSQTIPTSSGYASIPFTVSDAESAAETLTVQAFGDNPALISDASMFVDGLSTSRNLILWPPVGRTGTMTITLRASDGELSFVQSFAVTLVPVVPPTSPPNTPPSISQIGDQIIPATLDSIVVPFTITDTETPASNLALLAWTDDSTLIPDANLSLGGAGMDRTLTVHRQAGVNGETTVSVMVGDGQSSAVRTFDVTISPPLEPVNTAPNVAPVANQTVPVGTGTISVSLNVSDAESPANTLTVTAWADDASLIPDGNITIDGSGASRTLLLRPAPNRTGTTALDLSVSDGQMSTTTSFVITVSPDVTVDGRLRIQSIRGTASPGMTLTWATEPGQVYQVLAKDRLEQSYWTIISPKLIAYSSNHTWTDLSATGPSRIYQIRTLATISPLQLPPRLLSLTPNRDGEMQLQWTGQWGASYRVVAKESLEQRDWLPISSELIANGPIVSWIDYNGWGFDTRFYKIEILP